MKEHLFGALLAFCLAGTCWGTPPIASRYNDVYPDVTSKKGLQVERVDDALALGIKHAAINVNLAGIIAPNSDGNSDTISFEHEGRSYQFRRGYLKRLDQQIKPLSDRGVVVNVILLAYATGNQQVDRILLHPNYDRAAPNRLGAFNSETPDGKAWLVATLRFLAERWSRPSQEHGRVCGYIVGNEVNSHWWWANMGRVTLEDFATSYHRVVRWMHGAIRSQSSWARVYISLEHHWNIHYPPADAQQAFPGRAFVDEFARLAKTDPAGDFDWHVAFHPYPESLFEPRFWNDKSATSSFDTPRITFKNIELLPKYLDRPELHYQGAPRRIILSEQGFHSNGTEQGEQLQAAAYCYAYRKVSGLAGIDSFILHRHIDHPREGGLNLGLRRRVSNSPDQPKKKIYECFLKADTADWEQAFEFALPIIGLENWES